MFWENYFLHKEDIFSKVQCMIFVFNVDSKEIQVRERAHGAAGI